MAEAWEESLPRLLLEMGYWGLQRGALADAEVLLRGAQALRPNDPTPNMFLGLVHFSSRRYGDAEATYRRILEKHEDDLTRAFLGEALIAQKRWDEAKQELETVVKQNLNPSAVTFARELLDTLAKGIFQRAAQ
jgi:Flp pilus assembly protein TadD